MNTDRFKFRFWDNHDERFYDGREFELSDLQLDYKLGVFEQCTGQKDQSGKLVYEGDIVEQYSPMEDCNRRCVVVWEDGPGGGYVCKYLDEKRSSGCFMASSEGTYFDGGYCRVVGNIHQNPEMVK